MDSASSLEAPASDRDAQALVGHLLFFVRKLADIDATARVRWQKRPSTAA